MGGKKGKVEQDRVMTAIVGVTQSRGIYFGKVAESYLIRSE